MRVVEFRSLLDAENALRVWFEVDSGEVQRFRVQLECLFQYWTAVLRYDMAHGFADCDKIHPYGDNEKVRMVTQDYNEALTVAIQDVSLNWRRYRRRYQE